MDSRQDSEGGGQLVDVANDTQNNTPKKSGILSNDEFDIVRSSSSSPTPSTWGRHYSQDIEHTKLQQQTFEEDNDPLPSKTVVKFEVDTTTENANSLFTQGRSTHLKIPSRHAHYTSHSTESRRSSQSSSHHGFNDDSNYERTRNEFPRADGSPIPENKPYIEEKDSELWNDQYHSSTDRIEADRSAAIDSIKGQEFSLRAHSPSYQAVPSVITDRGDQEYAKLEVQGRTPSFPIPPNHSTKPKKTLGDLLFASAKATSRPHDEFIPNDQMESLVNQETVAFELERCLSATHTRHTINEYVHLVCYGPSEGRTSGKIISYRKIFIVLVLIEMLPAIGKFLKEGVSDVDLPLRAIERDDDLGTYGLRRRTPTSPDLNLESCEEWSQSRIRDFEKRQWMILAPFFTKGERKKVQHYPLDDRVILPFPVNKHELKHRHEKEQFEGGFGRVFKVDIHPNHHNFDNHKTSNSGFAIKKLFSTDKENFDREVDMLKRFSGNSHPHLISLLATYAQGNDYFLIFHWAQADLLRYWTKLNPNPVLDHPTVLWVIKQCEGIADGLSNLHRYDSMRIKKSQGSLKDPDSPISSSVEHKATQGLRFQRDDDKQPLYGRHGDIKPQNILWYKSPSDPNHKGTLKISDFGVAELNSRKSRSNKTGSKIAISPTYRPPECDIPGQTIGRSYDIWTLGCLYLEFITWLLGGCKLFYEFTKSRKGYMPGNPNPQEDTFFEISRCDSTQENTVSVKKTVIEFFGKLHSNPKCTRLLHEFLDIIEQGMLIVESYDPDGRRRISCGQVYKKLEKLRLSCEADRNFAVKPISWQTVALE